MVLLWRATGALADHVWIFDPAMPQNLTQLNGPFTPNLPPCDTSFNIFCSAHAKTENGELLIAGGSEGSHSIPGLASSFLLDPVTASWSPAGCMTHARWYPTLTRRGTNLFQATGGWENINNVWNDYETYDASPMAMSWMVGPSAPAYASCGLNPGLPFWLYPRVHLLSTGNLFTSGDLPCSVLIDPVTGTYTEKSGVPLPAGANLRDHGCAFRYPNFVAGTGTDNIVVLGGSPTFDPGDPALDLVLVNSNPEGTGTWMPVNNDPNFKLLPGRTYANTVILPDGSILIVGGSSRQYAGGQGWALGVPDDPNTGQPYPPEKFPKPVLKSALLYRDAMGIWKLQETAQTDVARLYHSLALLLPSGNVLSAGGEQVMWSELVDDDPSLSGIRNADVTIYSPPYMFKGPRPAILSAPTGPLGYTPAFPFDVQFRVGSATDPIAKVVLIRPGSVTHHFDFEQRHVELTSNPHPTLPNTLQVTPPANNNIAPTGYWMLFLVSQAGIPSEAKFVQFL